MRPDHPLHPSKFPPGPLDAPGGCVGIRDGGADLLLAPPFRRRDVFLRGSHGHRVWISQRPEAGEEAYCVILKGRDRDSPTGDIRSFDFSAHLHRLEHTAVEAKAVELVFYSGRRFSMEPERYRAAMEDLFWEYGTLRRIRYLPENEAALVRTIMMEHRYQKGWMPKKDRAPPSGPVR